MAHAVFISYADNDKDRKIALAVCSNLESRGIHCWMAPRDILPGKHYAEAIVEAINAAKVMVLVLSSGANSSPQVLREVERAASKDIPILTFRVEDVPLKKSLEYFLSSYHWLDATRHPVQDKLKELADNVQRLVSPSGDNEYTEQKQMTIPTTIPAAGEKINSILLFWIGLLMLVGGTGFMTVLGITGFAIDNYDVKVTAISICASLALFGILLTWLASRKIRYRWFWVGAVVFIYGITALPTLLLIWYYYTEPTPIPSTLAIYICVFAFPAIALGAFCLWRGWPRMGVKHPRVELSSFYAVTLILCLATIILCVSNHRGIERNILSFSDNFQNGKYNLPWYLDRGWQVVNENGNYVLSCQSQDFQRAWPRVTSASDYALSADFNLLQGQFEFQVRRSNTGSYNILIYDNRVVLGKETGKNIVDLGNADMDIGTSQWHKIEISLNGGNIKVYIDDYLKIDYQDENPLPLGIFLIQNHPDSGVELDNILVKPSSMPTPTPTPTPTLTPTPTITPISKLDILSFSDNFQDGNAYGWDLAPGWQVANEHGNYFLSCQGKDFALATPRVTSESDYVLQADFMVISGTINFVIRMNYDGYYGVGIGDNVVFLGKNITVHDRVADAVISLGDNQWHSVKIAIKGGNIKVDIDGENRIDYWDSEPLPTGGVAMQNGGNNSSVRVDNIVVSPNNTSTPTPTPQATVAVAFADDFQDGVTDGWMLDYGWQVVNENGNYVLSCETQSIDQVRADPPLNSSIDNYILEADILLSNGLSDFHVRSSDIGCYAVMLRNARVSLDKAVSGKAYLSDLTWASTDIGPNKWHKLKITLKGAYIEVYIDGNLKLTYSDLDPLMTGYFYIECHSYSQVRVDNIVVTEI